jgi:murein DD-endopeptidase MepM/ murein hydrolase activator NlpD
MPTEGSVQYTFGRRRVINGQPRNPHTGEDISAPQGAPVAAINYGTVRLVADQFFSGKSVVIDHGLGLYSMYFHLSEIAVRVGDLVAKSQVIGAVGATGRASGPHLHWGVRLNGARVNPLSLNIALNGVMTAAP